MDSLSYHQKTLELLNQNSDFVTVTLTSVKGSAPQNLGAKMIVYKDDILFGTVGGGKVEAHCIKVAKEILDTSDNQLSFTWNLQKDIGMTCGGEVSFLFEKHICSQLWNIAIFGAGHVSQALTRLLINLNCKLTVVDTRKEWLDKLPHDPKLTKIHTDNPAEVLKKLEVNTFVILMTKGHSSDVPVLEEALRTYQFPYLGVIGSKSKRNVMEKELLSLGLPNERAREFICPIGDDFGTNDPFEISHSIIAQLIRERERLSLSSD